MTQVIYTEELPTTYASSSEMSPDRREFYLSHKSGSRTVYSIMATDVASFTSDARMPIDLCCVHTPSTPTLGEKVTYIFFSSKMINVAKVKDEQSNLSKVAKAALEAIKKNYVRLDDSITSRLPRKKAMRVQTGYDLIPLDSNTGALLLDESHYPASNDSEKSLHSLSTQEWYVWFSILLEYPGNKTTVMTFENEKYFVLQNNYHLVVHKL